MKNESGIYTLLTGLIISIVLIASIAIYKNEIARAFLQFGEQHPGVLRAAAPVILLLALMIVLIKTKK